MVNILALGVLCVEAANPETVLAKTCNLGYGMHVKALCVLHRHALWCICFKLVAKPSA